MKVYNTSGVILAASESDRAPLSSPSFTGIPLAPTASIGTSSTQIATTAFVQTAIVVWSSVTGTSKSADINKGYVVNNVGLVTVTLPVTAAIGDSVSITGVGSGLWKLAQNSGQVVNLLATPTTTGATGYIAGTTRYDCVTVRCVVANSTWVVENCVGAITVA